MFAPSPPKRKHSRILGGKEDLAPVLSVVIRRFRRTALRGSFDEEESGERSKKRDWAVLGK